MNPADQNSRQMVDFDHGISTRLAGVVILALLGVFLLQKLGFRFVVSAKTGVSA